MSAWKLVWDTVNSEGWIDFEGSGRYIPPKQGIRLQDQTIAQALVDEHNKVQESKKPVGLEASLEKEIRGQKVAKICQLLSGLITSEIQRVEETKRGLTRRDGGRSMAEACCAREILDLIEDWRD